MCREKEKVYDSFLAASARLGDRQALARLAERWQPRLLAHARRLAGEHELAADVAQQAWVEIIRGISKLRDCNAFAPWAYRIVTHRCARAIARRQRQRGGLAALARECETATEESDHCEQQTELGIVKAAMTELPREQQAAMALFYLDGLRIAEIAVALDIAPGTVKTRLMHARNKLRAKLEGEIP